MNKLEEHIRRRNEITVENSMSEIEIIKETEIKLEEKHVINDRSRMLNKPNSFVSDIT